MSEPQDYDSIILYGGFWQHFVGLAIKIQWLLSHFIIICYHSSQICSPYPHRGVDKLSPVTQTWEYLWQQKTVRS